MHMKRLGRTVCMAIGILTLIAPAFPESTADQNQGQAIVTIMPQKNIKTSVSISRQDLQVKVNGKETGIDDWVPLRGRDSDIELVILIDSSARASLGMQLGEIDRFIQSLPANVKVAVGSMVSGRAVLAGPPSTDHAQAASELHIPNGTAGSNSSPYFCLSDLAKHWPSTEGSARREVVLITDGVDSYYGLYDPEDPYVNAAINDSVRAGLVVYSIYWRDQGYRRNPGYESFDGQNLLAQVTQATGGRGYWDGNGDPVSFNPFFDDIAWRLQNQYRLSFHSLQNGKPGVRSMEFKARAEAIEVYAPQRVYVGHPK